MSNETRHAINQVLGISKDHELVIVEDVFEYTDGFKGATGYHMGVITQDEIASAKEEMKDEIKYLWQQAVANKETEMGLVEYQNMLYHSRERDQCYTFDDNSFRRETEKIVDKQPDDIKAEIYALVGRPGSNGVVDWDCSSCGRCISANEDDYEMIFNRELFDLVKKYEKE